MKYIVSGMHRTGTSVMMGALNRSGIPAYYDVARESGMQHGQKERGYFANKKFWEVGEHIYMNFGFSRQIPDNMCCKIAMKGIPLLAGGVEHKVIFMRRDPVDIRSSAKAAFTEMDFDEYYPDWVNFYPHLVKETKALLDARDDCEYIEVEFNDLMDDPITTFTRIAEFVPIDPIEAAKEINPVMVRHRA